MSSNELQYFNKTQKNLRYWLATGFACGRCLPDSLELASFLGYPGWKCSRHIYQYCYCCAHIFIAVFPWIFLIFQSILLYLYPNSFIAVDMRLLFLATQSLLQNIFRYTWRCIFSFWCCFYNNTYAPLIVFIRFFPSPESGHALP